MIRYDIDLTAADITANNDIGWRPSDMQHIEDTIASNPGEWKQHPADGVGLTSFLNSSGREAAIGRKVIIQLQSDLYDCDNPTVVTEPDGTVAVKPNVIIEQ